MNETGFDIVFSCLLGLESPDSLTSRVPMHQGKGDVKWALVSIREKEDSGLGLPFCVCCQRIRL